MTLIRATDQVINSDKIGILSDIQVNVKAAPYNAKGDGTAYESSIIQSAINASTSKTVIIPNGTYKLNSTLTVNNKLKIKGESRDGTILLIDSTTDIDIFDLWAACEISDLTIQINNPNHTKAAFKYRATIGGNRYGEISNVHVIGTGYTNQTKALEFAADPAASNHNAYAYFWNFKDFVVNYCMSAFYTAADFNQVWTTGCTFDNFILESCVRAVWFNTTYVTAFYSRYDFLAWQFQCNSNMNRIFESPSDRSIVDIHIWDRPQYAATPKSIYIKGDSRNNIIKLRNVTSDQVELEKSACGAFNQWDITDDPKLTKNVVFATTIYIDGVNGSDTTGNGASASPYKTIAYVLGLLPSRLTANVTINLAPATYNESIALSQIYGGGMLTIQGTNTDPTQTVVNNISLSDVHVRTFFQYMTIASHDSSGAGVFQGYSEYASFFNINIGSTSGCTNGYSILASRCIIRNPDIKNCTSAAILANTDADVRVDTVTGSGNAKGLNAASGIIHLTTPLPGGFATTQQSATSAGLIIPVAQDFGTATIATGTTSIIITHGLGYTPAFINVTPQANVGNVWVSGVNSTQFTINCSTAPTGGAPVSWHARA